MKYYTAPELAKLLGVGPEKVARWINTGELEAINIGEGKIRPRWRISAAAIERFEARRSNQRHRREQQPTPRRRQKVGRVQYV